TDAPAPTSRRKDPRLRTLGVLTGAAVLSTGLAVLALWHQAALVAPHYTPETFFPNLSVKMRHVARIHIVSKAKGAFDVAFTPDRGWVLPSMHNYPADFKQVRTLLVGLVGLETIQPETSRAGWLRYLDLGNPAKGGKGVAISLLDDQGHTIAALVAGKTSDIGETGGAERLFVRRLGSDQSWLTRSVFVPKPDADDWLDKTLLSVDRSRIQEADVTPADGPSYTMRRAKPEDPDFALINIPKGRQLAYPDAPDDVAAAIVGFSFDKVAPASQFNFANAARVMTKTFDGLDITVAVVKQGTDYWATVPAEAQEGKSDARKEATAIDRRSNGWAYRIPPYKGAQFMTTLESLLKPVVSNAKVHRTRK
ncbi:MAG: DUF4340 domain-containing protein, partial [Alphaproteobacteria bacterium]|nr:DUF4340 domain-containing protein [Alphaproteobacteria bacterium]